MNFLKRAGARVIIPVTLIGGGLIYKAVDGKSETTSLKVGECVYASDVPSYSKTPQPDSPLPLADETVSGEYPVVACDEWKTQKDPDRVMQVLWQLKADKSVEGPQSDASKIAETCDGYSIYEDSDNGGVTCLQYMVVMDDMQSKHQVYLDDAVVGECAQVIERPEGPYVAQTVSCDTPDSEESPTLRVESNSTAPTFAAADAINEGCPGPVAMLPEEAFMPGVSRVVCFVPVSDGSGTVDSATSGTTVPGTNPTG